LRLKRAFSRPDILVQIGKNPGEDVGVRPVIGSRGSLVKAVIEWQNNLESFYLVDLRLESVAV
jgi:hypothetical protein